MPKRILAPAGASLAPVGGQALRRVRRHPVGRSGLRDRPERSALRAERPIRSAPPRGTASQPAVVRARIGLHMIAHLRPHRLAVRERAEARAPRVRVAAARWRRRSFATATHEVIEEAQHSLFFHEFVRRTGLASQPPRILGVGDRPVLRFARRFPELFFLVVRANRSRIASSYTAAICCRRAGAAPARRAHQPHPRHRGERATIAFARHFLRRNVPMLRGLKMLAAATCARRVVMAVVCRGCMTFAVDGARRAHLRHPLRGRVAEAYGPGAALRCSRQATRCFKPRELCWDLGVLTSAGFADVERFTHFFCPRAVAHAARSTQMPLGVSCPWAAWTTIRCARRHTSSPVESPLVQHRR